MTLLLCLQLMPVFIQGDEKLTLEGNKYGLYMFEANHQCISTTRIFFHDGKVRTDKRESKSARDRCDPYRVWFHIKNKFCERMPGGVRVAWTFDHSINGGPFLRIVDVEDVCTLSYHALKHNAWIRTERDKPPVIGYPVENIYE